MVTAPTGAPLGLVAEQAWERTGAGSVMIFEDRRWSGAELGARARRVAAGLLRAGVGPGDRVVVMMANCPEVSVTYQATWRAGGVVTPVLFLLSEDELRHVLADSGATMAVTTPEFLAKLRAAARSLPRLRVVVAGAPEEWLDPGETSFAELEDGPEGELQPTDPEAPCALLYTGGTTGRSKGVVLSHDALSAAGWTAAAGTVGNPADDSLLLPLPLSHVYGLMVTVAGLHTPAPRTSVLMRWFDPVGFLDLAEQHRVTSAAVVPSMLQLLLAQPLEERDLVLHRVSSGGAPLPREVAEEFARRVPGVEIGEGYGCTETAGIISTSPAGAVRPGSVGRPAPGLEVRIELPSGGEAGPGEDGEICVRGAGVMTGYWNAEEETAHALRGGWLHTGDIGHLDADGYLWVVDRIKDVIIRNGFNVYPRDVEEVLLQHPGVAAAAVVGRPDPVTGEEVVAHVQRRPGPAGDTLTEDELIAFAREHLSAAKYPREVRFVGAVPLTSVGKIDRKALRARD